MGARDKIDAATAAVKRELERGSSAEILAAQIEVFAAASTPHAVSFDPYELRRFAIKLAEVEATKEQAGRLARALTEALPSDAHNWATRALVARMRGAHGEVREAATRALEMRFEPKMPRMYRAYAALQLGDPKMAFDDAEVVLAMDVVTEDERASMRSVRDQARQILKDIQIMRDLREDLVSGRRNAENLVRQWTGAALTSQDFADALERKRLIGKEHGWTLSHSYGVAEAAYVYFQRGDYKFARELFAALTLMNPMDGYMWTMRAAGDSKLGDIEAALFGYGKALELDPRSIVARSHRAEILFNRGDIDAALLDITVAVARDPEGQDLQANRARMIGWAIGDVLPEYAERAASARGPLRLSADWAEDRARKAAQLRDGLRAAETGFERITDRQLLGPISDDELVAMVRAAIAPDGPIVLARQRFGDRAVALAQEERTRDQARALARSLTRAFPEDFQMWKQRALVALAASDFADATLATTRAIDRGATDPVLFYLRALSLFRSFEPEPALADVERVLGNPDVPASLKSQLAAQHQELKLAVAAVRVLAEARPQLADGGMTAQDLVRRWSPIPLTLVDLRDAAAGTRRLIETFDWSQLVLFCVAARAEAFAAEGQQALAHRIASALLLVDHADVAIRQLVDATAPAAPAPTPAPPAQRKTDRTPEPGDVKVRILFLAANPSDQTRLALPGEANEIGERLHGSDGRNSFQVLQHWELQATKLPTLILRHRPQIVHFSGHGDPSGELIFQNASGGSAPVPIEAIATIFRVLSRHVRCVVLSACYSQPQAAAIAEHVDVVIGMSAAIRDTSAIAFAGSFYENLGYGLTVQEAFDLATAIVLSADATSGPTRDFLTAAPATAAAEPPIPRLLVRDGVDASQLRFANPAD